MKCALGYIVEVHLVNVSGEKTSGVWKKYSLLCTATDAMIYSESASIQARPSTYVQDLRDGLYLVRRNHAFGDAGSHHFPQPMSLFMLVFRAQNK